jgi:hypothetical protein
LLRYALGGEPAWRGLLRRGKGVSGRGPAAEAARAAHEPDAVTVIPPPFEPKPARGAEPIVSGDVSLSPWSLAAAHQNADSWPARRDIVCAHAITQVAANRDPHVQWGASWLLPRFLDQPLPPLAVRFVTLALAFEDAEDRLVATDVLIAAIEDGRVDAHGLIPHLRMDLPFMLATRVAKPLTTIAAAGALHRAVVREALDATIDRVSEKPGPLLVLFDELCAQSGVGSRRSREHLRTLKHKAARALLEREGDPPEGEAQLALAARVRRAERWLEAQRRIG